GLPVGRVSTVTYSDMLKRFNTIANTNFAALHHAGDHPHAPGGLAPQLALQRLEAVTAAAVLHHFDHRILAKLNPVARFQHVDIQPFDDNLLAHLAGFNLKALAAQLHQRFIRHDVKLALGVLAFTV